MDFAPRFRNTLKAEDKRSLSAFEYRCLRVIGRMWQKNFMSSSDIRRKLLGPSVQFSKQALNQKRFGWLGHVFGVPIKHFDVRGFVRQAVIRIWFEVVSR